LLCFNAKYISYEIPLKLGNVFVRLTKYNIMT